MIKVKNLYFSYPCGTKILENVSFEIDKGRFVAILGNNGVGKSTLLKCLNKILRPQSGSVLLDDINITNMKEHDIAKIMAFVGQRIPAIQMTVHDMVMLGRKPHMKWKFTEEDHRIVHNAMEKIGLVGDIQGRFLSNLSGGEGQKVILARALAQKPKLLLLDEPTSNLDIKNQYEVLTLVKNVVKEQNITCIMVIHDINLAMKYCDEFIFLKDKEIYSYGDISTIDEELIYNLYGIKSEIISYKNEKIMVI